MITNMIASRLPAKRTYFAGRTIWTYRRTDGKLGRVKKWFQGRGWWVKIGDGEGRKNMPARSHSSLANAIHWIDEGSAGVVLDVNIWWIKQDGISVIKFEAVQLHFLSNIFVTLAVIVA